MTFDPIQWVNNVKNMLTMFWMTGEIFASKAQRWKVLPNMHGALRLFIEPTDLLFQLVAKQRKNTEE